MSDLALGDHPFLESGPGDELRDYVNSFEGAMFNPRRTPYEVTSWLVAWQVKWDLARVLSVDVVPEMYGLTINFYKPMEQGMVHLEIRIGHFGQGSVHKALE